jgi:hypothetical protein
MHFGAAVGTIDVTVNIQAIIVETAAGRAMMSGFHGLFSVGGIVGSGLVSALLWAGVTPVLAVLCIVACIVVAVIVYGRALLPYGSDRDAPLFVIPRGVVIVLGVLSLLTFMAEGAVLDWGAVYLTTVREIDPTFAGWGFTVFSVAMTICRLTGDRIVQGLGGVNVLRWGGLLAAAGTTLVVVAPVFPVALVGFALVGVGASNIVPVLFSAAGRQTVMPPNFAIAAMTVLGYTGVLLGPALLGFIAQATSHAVALLGVALTLLMVAASARIATRTA